ncbi:cysteine desulfurase family protein [Natribacillus halophilus]|uniref:Cysteine desulfurase n=1 Tax=Natribacillus halophilus TaxID=549003 RepID=A0A1G8NEB6_9BACI|nr:cysteine desulfurase family protein [Natribacillus halophilus]SDI78492.1 cysteine desulfurase [Natribacillus halophilus]
MIYLDNSATTVAFSEVLETYQKTALRYFGNPSSLHGYGSEAEHLLRQARQSIAGILDIKANELIFTSGGTEGNNLAIKGVAYARRRRGNHIITTAVEHPSVLNTCRYLEKNGFEVTYLPVDNDGFVSLQDVKDASREETILVSIMHVNHETGAIQPVEKIGEWLKTREKIRFHVDHVQGAAKVPLHLHNSGIDLCTLSGHKFHGLKGTGMLYIREGVQIEPLLHGGGQEQNLRSGTENLPGIVAFAKALRLAYERYSEAKQALQTHKHELMQALRKREGMLINTPEEGSAPHIINVSISGTRPEIVIQALSKKDIHVSSKSACSARLQTASEVLDAQFGPGERAETGLRFSLGYNTTEVDIQQLLEALDEVVPEIRRVKEVKA